MSERKKRKFEETIRFLQFLEETGRRREMEKHKETSKCIVLPEDYSAIATEEGDHGETREHFYQINRSYEDFREHALSCRGCQLSLDSILLFKGFNSRRLFPKKIQKILCREWNYGSKRGIYIGKLPAPHSGTFSNKARLVYLTSLPIKQGVKEFVERIQKPLGLKSLVWNKGIVLKRTRDGKGESYLQANAHDKHDNWHTYISVRSRYRS